MLQVEGCRLPLPLQKEIHHLQRWVTSEAMEDAGQDDSFSAKDHMLWNRKLELQPCEMKLLDDLGACYSFLIKIVVLGSKLPVIHLGVNVASVILIESVSLNPIS